MRRVTGLSIIAISADPGRFRSALGLAAAHAALGGRTRLLLDGEASRLVILPPDDLLQTCFDLGASITICQSGLAAVGVDAGTLDPRFTYGGLVGML
ncbi:MAG TPA: hypothetical protein VNT42_04760, partial [Sphingomonas sp.]|nr:hypothetical protein [Sphingomonas sp.]